MEFLDEIIELFNTGKHNDVIDRITDFLNQNPQYKTIDYYHFANPLEETLFDFYIERIQNVKTLPLDEPLEEIYHIYAMAHASKNDLDNALKYLNIANQINPVSAPILMMICEIYQQRHEEEKIKGIVCDIFKYTYHKDILISNYFKLADYLFHTNQNMELYDHLFNFFLYLKSGDEEKPIKEDIKYFKNHGVQVGFNEEIISMLLYLMEMFKKQGMETSAQFFVNILKEVVDFNRTLIEIEQKQ